MADELQIAKRKREAQELQRQRQQGLGRPIISAEAFGERFVAVKGKLYHSKKWKTFHGFLGDYIKETLGTEWGNVELAKPLDERHPITLWYHFYCLNQRKYILEEGKVQTGEMTGACAAYMHLAYDLYALDHNSELQAKLLNRLRNTKNYAGARYEIFVAAALIRAGFEIEYDEDEDDRNSTHCEFTATYKKTGRKFSVEAKHRDSSRFRVGRQLNRALIKVAPHERIVFIDINVPDEAGDGISRRLISSARAIHSFEGKLNDGEPRPNAYLFITNTPWHHHLEGPAPRIAALMDGFQIPELHAGFAFPTLRAQIESRERHIELVNLFQSMQDHMEVPATFDGEIPEFAFGDGAPRLLVGNRYCVKDKNGNDAVGTLTSAVVIEKEQKAMCAVSLENGESNICSWPLSDLEMQAWRRHPDTFFGDVGQRKATSDSPLELYDFFLNSYRNTPKKRLLELMANATDIEELRKLEQPALASVFAERTVYGALRQMAKSAEGK